jgi:hypothetical protein
VREVAPQADPVTRIFEVKVGLSDAPSTSDAATAGVVSTSLRSLAARRLGRLWRMTLLRIVILLYLFV